MRRTLPEEFKIIIDFIIVALVIDLKVPEIEFKLYHNDFSYNLYKFHLAFANMSLVSSGMNYGGNLNIAVLISFLNSLYRIFQVPRQILGVLAMINSTAGIISMLTTSLGQLLNRTLA